MKAFAVDTKRPVEEDLAPSRDRAPRNPSSLLEVRFPCAQKSTVRKVRPRPAPLRRIPWHGIVGHVLATTDTESCGQLHRLWRALCARLTLARGVVVAHGWSSYCHQLIYLPKVAVPRVCYEMLLRARASPLVALRATCCRPRSCASYTIKLPSHI